MMGLSLALTQRLERRPTTKLPRAIRSFDQVDSEGFLLVNLECCACGVHVQITGADSRTWGAYAFGGSPSEWAHGWEGAHAEARAALIEQGCRHAEFWPKVNVALCPPGAAEGVYP